MPYVCKRIGCYVFAAALILEALRIVASFANCTSFTMELSVNDLRSMFELSPLAVQPNNFSSFGPESDLVNTFAALLLIVGGMMLGFSRCKHEDEFTEQLRYQSLVLSVYLNAALLIIGYLCFWGLSFLIVMQINLFSTLVFYLIYFHVRAAVERKKLGHEE